MWFRSPNFPRSNGLAKKGVAISKNILRKALGGKDDRESALLAYRNIPLKVMNYLPSQLFNSRRCKTKVPINAETRIMY